MNTDGGVSNLRNFNRDLVLHEVNLQFDSESELAFSSRPCRTHTKSDQYKYNARKNVSRTVTISHLSSFKQSMSATPQKVRHLRTASDGEFLNLSAKSTRSKIEQL